MNISILITASAIYTGREVLRDGYVYIEDGIVKDVGPQPPPDDVQDATLIIGGPGRVVVPGLTAVADVAAYGIRYSRPTIGRRVEFYRRLSDDELFKLSLPGVYELHMMGVTTIFVESLSPRLPFDLARKVGGFYGAARPTCVEEFRVQPTLRGLISIGGGECPAGDVADGDRESLVLTGTGGYNIDGIADVLQASSKLRRLAGLPDPLIEPNSTAEIAVFDTSRPPAMFLYAAGEDLIRTVYTSRAYLETLIAGQDVLVEMGEHLRIGRKHLEEATNLVRRLGLMKELET